jgi:hypothetical protein
MLHYGIRYNVSVAALARNNQDVFHALQDINEDIIRSMKINPFVNVINVFRPRISTKISKFICRQFLFFKG